VSREDRQMKEEEVCVWQYHRGRWFPTCCQAMMDQHSWKWIRVAWVFCPYCGKRIEEKK